MSGMSRTRRRVVAPAGGSAMPSSHLGLELQTRACGPRSLLLGMESRSGVSAAVLPSTNPQLKYTAMSWLWSSVHSTLIAVQQTAHSAVVDGTTRGRKTHHWKKKEDERRRRRKRMKSEEVAQLEDIHALHSDQHVTPANGVSGSRPATTTHRTEQPKNRTRYTNTVEKHDTHVVQARKRTGDDKQTERSARSRCQSTYPSPQIDRTLEVNWERL